MYVMYVLTTSMHTQKTDRRTTGCTYVHDICTYVRTSVESDDRTTSVSWVAKGALCCWSPAVARVQTSCSTALGLNVQSLRSSLSDSFLRGASTLKWQTSHKLLTSLHHQVFTAQQGTALAQTVHLIIAQQHSIKQLRMYAHTVVVKSTPQTTRKMHVRQSASIYEFTDLKILLPFALRTRHASLLCACMRVCV